MMLTCVFLASKIEEEIINAHELENETNIKQMDILRMELVLLQGLRFELRVYHPYRIVLGFIEDMRIHFEKQGHALELGKLRLLHEKTNMLIDELLVCSNLMLIHPPAHLALGVLTMAAEAESFQNIDVSGYLQQKFGVDERFPELATTLKSVKSSLKQDMEEFRSIEKKQLKGIMKKLKNCATWSERYSSGPPKAKKQKISGESKPASVSNSSTGKT